MPTFKRQKDRDRQTEITYKVTEGDRDRGGRESREKDSKWLVIWDRKNQTPGRIKVEDLIANTILNVLN